MTTHTPVHARQVRPIGVASRMLVTALGAAGLIVAAFLKWTRDMKGIDTSWRAVYQDTFGGAPDAVHSVGGPAIVLGLLAVLGLAERSGWLTRLAGALGVIGTVLVVVQIERATDHSIQWGIWSALAGSILCIGAGLTSTRATVTTVDEA
ncbi:sugar:proton symporter [Catenulispora subtropica]|uniref:Integral membrane protein n=1 Tax=Catenulispora subtropica TaxID=450798 RepID=A0ABN2TDR8_9ACTN